MNSYLGLLPKHLMEQVNGYRCKEMGFNLEKGIHTCRQIERIYYCKDPKLRICVYCNKLRHPECYLNRLITSSNGERRVESYKSYGNYMRYYNRKVFFCTEKTSCRMAFTLYRNKKQ